MARNPFVTEICPGCGHGWQGSPAIVDGKPTKTCPNCSARWPSHKLLEHRKKLAGSPLRNDAVKSLRGLGMANECEALQVGLASMIAGYDQALATLPEGSVARALVEGAFGSAPKLARGLI